MNTKGKAGIEYKGKSYKKRKRKGKKNKKKTEYFLFLFLIKEFIKKLEKIRDLINKNIIQCKFIDNLAILDYTQYSTLNLIKDAALLRVPRFQYRLQATNITIGFI